MSTLQYPLFVQVFSIITIVFYCYIWSFYGSFQWFKVIDINCYCYETKIWMEKGFPAL